MEEELRKKILIEQDYKKALDILKSSEYRGDLDKEVIEHLGKIGNLESMEYNFYLRKEKEVNKIE